mmetsp:Transcript_104144/g.334032  ORF Transcript_104144/g.334032 Transcript_104144/m.334032 type:complete len:308 (+) Transcript_104144:146-1069(+)
MRRSGSEEGWRFFNLVPGSLQEVGTWASGFSRAPQHGVEIDDLGPLELFRWLSEALGLGEADIDAMHACEGLPHEGSRRTAGNSRQECRGQVAAGMAENAQGMAEQIYVRLMENPAIRARLKIDDADGGAANGGCLARRKSMLQKYLAWLLNLKREPLESYASRLDHVASLHNSATLMVPRTHLLTGLAVTHDVILRHVCAGIEDKEQSERVVLAVSKLMWIQAVFFLRHSTRTAQSMPAKRLPRWTWLALLWAMLSLWRCSSATIGPSRIGQALADLAFALAGSCFVTRLLSPPMPRPFAVCAREV